MNLKHNEQCARHFKFFSSLHPFFWGGGCVALLEGLSIQKDTNHQRNEARKGKKERGVKMEVSSLFKKNR